MGRVTLSSWALQGQGLCLEVGSLLSVFMSTCPRASDGPCSSVTWALSLAVLSLPPDVASPTPSMLWASCLVGRAASPQETLIARDAK